MSDDRTIRVRQDESLMGDLAGQHTWLTVVSPPPAGEPSGRWRIQIQGRGLASGGPSGPQYEIGDLHEIELAFPTDYPNEPPQVRMLTPVFHPNIAPDGVIAMSDMGIAWEPALTVDIVIERIWDRIRGARVDLENAINPAAARWYASQGVVDFPLDQRSLSLHRSQPNIVRYRHKHRNGETPLPPVARPVMIIQDPPDQHDENDAIHFIE